MTTTNPFDAQDFLNAFNFDMSWEGRIYENVAGDSGGPTKWGITWIDGNEWRRSKGLKPLTEAEAHATRLSYLTEAVIREIYYNHYWVPMKGAQLPSPLDQVLFDCAVNTGCSRSVKMLQGVIGTAQDGQFGPNTLAATQTYLSKHGQAPLCLALTTRRNAFYDGLAAARPKDRKFLGGWHNRVAALKQAVRRVLGIKASV